jgi:hypothetical protein
LVISQSKIFYFDSELKAKTQSIAVD